jgi:hypothetical protein
MPIQKSLVGSRVQLIIDRWIRKSAFPLYRVCKASAICKQLKKTDDIDLFVARFRQNDEGSIIDESLDLEPAVDGCIVAEAFGEIEHARRGLAQTKTRGNS